jgi:hypothetical protein
VHEGTPFDVVVTTITSTLPNAQPADFTAEIEWGDGHTETGIITANANGTFSVRGAHQFPDNSWYFLRVRVTDRDGNTAEVLSNINCQNVAPQNVNAGLDQTVAEGTLVSLAGTFTDPGLLDTHTRQWYVSSSNGQAVPGGTGANFSFTPSDNGTYTVYFSVNDNNGGYATDTAVITVTNVAPTATISGASEINEGLSYSLALDAGGDPGDDNVFYWTINWGDGTPVEMVSDIDYASHVYQQPGNYSISATVYDDDGGYPAGNTQSVTVHNVAPVLELAIAYECERWVTLSGRVLDADAAGLSVTFTGKVNACTTTDANGNYSLTVEASALGHIFASTMDMGGLASNIAQVTVQSQGPRIVQFDALHVTGNIWSITGRVEDESPAGLIITFSGLPSLNGRTAVVQADGTFYLSWEINPNETGNVTGVVTDWWGLQDDAYDIVYPIQ